MDRALPNEREPLALAGAAAEQVAEARLQLVRHGDVTQLRPQVVDDGGLEAESLEAAVARLEVPVDFVTFRLAQLPVEVVVEPAHCLEAAVSVESHLSPAVTGGRTIPSSSATRQSCF